VIKKNNLRRKSRQIPYSLFYTELLGRQGGE
jgi:hypothetical protein